MIDLLERLRRPQFTGENRCWPCTVANGVVLASLVGVLALRGRRRTATAVAAAGVSGIALRGYLVPYTPRFAPRLLAAVPIDPFDHDATGVGSVSDSRPDDDGRVDPAAPSGEAVLADLLEAGVVVPDGVDVALDPSFRTDWRDEMKTLREMGLEELAAVTEDLTRPSVDAHARRGWRRQVLVLEAPSGTPTTLRRGVAVAELAAVRALEPRVDSPEIRRAAGRPLRTLLERCPLCDGEVIVSRASCCGEVTPIGSRPKEKLVCPDCDERFFTFDDADE